MQTEVLRINNYYVVETFFSASIKTECWVTKKCYGFKAKCLLHRLIVARLDTQELSQIWSLYVNVDAMPTCHLTWINVIHITHFWKLLETTCTRLIVNIRRYFTTEKFKILYNFTWRRRRRPRKILYFQTRWCLRKSKGLHNILSLCSRPNPFEVLHPWSSLER